MAKKIKRNRLEFMTIPEKERNIAQYGNDKRMDFKKYLDHVLDANVDTLPRIIKTHLRGRMGNHSMCTLRGAIVFGMMLKAMDGDVKAAQWIRDTAGEAPALTIDNTFSGSVEIRQITNDMSQKEATESYNNVVKLKKG